MDGQALMSIRIPNSVKIFHRVGDGISFVASHDTVRAVPYTAFHLSNPPKFKKIQSHLYKQGVRDAYPHVLGLSVLPRFSAIRGGFPGVIFAHPSFMQLSLPRFRLFPGSPYQASQVGSDIDIQSFKELFSSIQTEVIPPPPHLWTIHACQG